MTSIPAATKSPASNVGEIADREFGWMDRVDQLCEQFGDTLNPILIKETRQALKSRQFVVTFSVLLFSALAWTVAYTRDRQAFGQPMAAG